MSNLMFFCIPAHGHMNPTIPVAARLTERGHRVRYYSFPEFREKIEAAGAEYVSCERFLPPAPENLDKKVGKDFSSLIGMVADTTIRMEGWIEGEMRAFRPDGILADSVCFWGKLFAQKYQIPLICSTTTLAFNSYTARLMKPGFGEILRSIAGMPRIRAKMELLKSHGYPVQDFLSVLQNDNDTWTILYTSRKFQPMAETFSGKYAFVGPSVEARLPVKTEKVSETRSPCIYISLGTVVNRQPQFYRRCIKALRDMDCQAVLSIGKNVRREELGEIPDHITVKPCVDQLSVLAGTDVFLTHCGMNSVNESLLMGVPMVLFPQHSEEKAVAWCARRLGTGVLLKRGTSKAIRKALTQVLTHESYRRAAGEMAEDFRRCGGAVMAAEFIERVLGAGR